MPAPLHIPHDDVALDAGWGSSWCRTRLLEAGTLTLRAGRVLLVCEPSGLLAGPLLRAVVARTGALPATLAPRADFFARLDVPTDVLRARPVAAAGVAPGEAIPAGEAPDDDAPAAVTLRRVAEPRPAAGAHSTVPVRPLAAVCHASRGRSAPPWVGLPPVDVVPDVLAAWLAGGAAVLAVIRTAPPVVAACVDVVVHRGTALVPVASDAPPRRRHGRRHWRARRHPPPLSR